MGFSYNGWERDYQQNKRAYDKAIKESVSEAFEKAIEQDLTDVMIMGFRENGEMVLSFACDSAPEMIFMLELVKREILDGARKTD